MAAKTVSVTLTIDPSKRGGPPPIKDIVVDGVKYRVVAIRELPVHNDSSMLHDPTRHRAVSFQPVGACPTCGR